MLLSQVSEIHARRRKAWMQSHPTGLLIAPGNIEATRNGSVTYPFRQDSTLHYLTGYPEAEAILVLAPAGKASKARSILFVRRREVERELWDGERYGVERARSIFGVDEAFALEEFEQRLPGLIADASEVHFAINHPRKLENVVLSAMEAAKKLRARTSAQPLTLHDPSVSVGEMRIIKSEEEAQLMRRAAQISAETHLEVMKAVRPGMNEAEVEGLLEFGFRKRGSKRHAYESIVAVGKNATCLHYRDNNEELRDGELLLIDAAGEYGMYASDITRTYPVGRKFSEPQARLYDIVLRAQKEGIALARPGVTIEEVHFKCVDVLVDGLIELGLLQGKRSELVQAAAHRRFYPHNTSHWLGLDVHDSGAYREQGGSRVLKPGMVITIEPGLYVQPNDTVAAAEYRGIGIRIEDDVLITDHGNEVMTAAVPKERKDVEAARAG
jgi:Xaa-Pro aminopeptidase